MYNWSGTNNTPPPSRFVAEDVLTPLIEKSLEEKLTYLLEQQEASSEENMGYPVGNGELKPAVEGEDDSGIAIVFTSSSCQADSASNSSTSRPNNHRLLLKFGMLYMLDFKKNQSNHYFLNT